MKFLIYMLIALSPLPLASARPSWQWLWVLVVALAALAFLIRSIRGDEIQWPKAIILPTILVFLFVIWGFIQTYIPISASTTIASLQTFEVISVNPALTINNTLYFLAHLLFFLSIFALCTRRDTAVNLLKLIGITVGTYAAYGFIVYVSGNDTILWFEKWASPNSLISTFVNRNSFSAYVGIGLQCLIAYAFFWAQNELAEGRSGRLLYRHILETMIVKAWWLPLAIFLTVSALLLTNSRAGFGSVVIGVLILFMLSPSRYHSDNSSSFKSILTVSIVVVVTAGLFALSGETLEQRLQGDATLDARFTAYPYMIHAIMDQPLTGFGLSTFEEVFRVYRGPDVIIYFDRAHSDYLEIAMNAGIPAASILIIACALPIITLSRALKHGEQYRSFIALGITVTLQLGLHSLVDFSLQMPAVSYTWVAVIAASMVIAVRCRKASAVDQ